MKKSDYLTFMNNKDSVYLKAIGDIAFFNTIFKKNSVSDFQKIIKSLNDTDILFGNFEFPYSKNKNPYFINSYEEYIACEKSIPLLQKLNFDILNIATNHIMDWGKEGLATTRKILQQQKIQLIGADKNLQSACFPTIIEKDGIKLGFLGYAKKGNWSATMKSCGASIIDVNLIHENIKNLKNQVDHVIVSLHWGVEFSNYPSPEDIEIAHQIIDCGASIILGHHPHVLQGIESYKNRYICYSLGNFFYDPFGEKVFVKNKLQERLETGIFSFKISKSSIDSFEFIPCRINKNLIPEVLELEEAEKLSQKLLIYSQKIGNIKHFYSDVRSNLLRRELETYLRQFKNPIKGLLFLKRNIKLKHFLLIKNLFFRLLNLL